MNTIRIRKHIDSETISLPELREFIGREVEFTVEEQAPLQNLETEETFFGLAPPEPTPEEHERNMNRLREQAKTDPNAAAWLSAIETEALDVERIIHNRRMQ